MNILFVTPAFLNKGINGTGMPMAIYRMAKGFQKLFDNPMIVTGGKIDRYEIFDGIPVWRVATEGKHTFNNKIVKILDECLWGNYLLQKKVNEICQKENIDIIQYAGNNGSGIFFHLDIPTVMRVSSYYKLCNGDFSMFSSNEVLLHSLFERIAMKRMYALYCPSQLLANYLHQEIKRKIEVFETVFYIEDIREDCRFFEKKLKGKKYLLYYGSMIPPKGVLIIADIINRVLERYEDYYFVFIGNDCMIDNRSMRNLVIEKVEKRYRKRVLFFPALEHKQLYPVIRAAELILQPSYMENLSNACMEAMALGKIVIGTWEAGYGQLINDSVSGFLVGVGNAKELYRCVDTVLNLSYEERRKIGERAKQRVEQLKPEISIPRLKEYYQKIVSHYKKKRENRI